MDWNVILHFGRLVFVLGVTPLPKHREEMRRRAQMDAWRNFASNAMAKLRSVVEDFDSIMRDVEEAA